MAEFFALDLDQQRCSETQVITALELFIDGESDA